MLPTRSFLDTFNTRKHLIHPQRWSLSGGGSIRSYFGRSFKSVSTPWRELNTYYTVLINIPRTSPLESIHCSVDLQRNLLIFKPPPCYYTFQTACAFGRFASIRRSSFATCRVRRTTGVELNLESHGYIVSILWRILHMYILAPRISCGFACSQLLFQPFRIALRCTELYFSEPLSRVAEWRYGHSIDMPLGAYWRASCNTYRGWDRKESRQKDYSGIYVSVCLSIQCFYVGILQFVWGSTVASRL